MNFDELIAKGKEQQSPDWNLDLQEDTGSQQKDLLSQIKSNNQRSMKTIKGLLYVMPISMAVLVVVFFFNPDPDLNYTHRLTGAFLILAFIWYMPFAYKWYMQLKASTFDYSVIRFLETSEMRHRFWHKDSWMLFPYILLTGGAFNTTIMGNYWPDQWGVVLGYLIINTFFLLFIGYAYWFNYRKWKKEKRELWLEIKSLLKEIQEN